MPATLPRPKRQIRQAPLPFWLKSPMALSDVVPIEKYADGRKKQRTFDRSGRFLLDAHHCGFRQRSASANRNPSTPNAPAKPRLSHCMTRGLEMT